MKYSLSIILILLSVIFGLTSKGFSQHNEANSYTVIKGDCLWKIAKMNYSAGKFWPEIWYANKDGVVNKEKIKSPKRKVIQNPNLIYPGQVLNIPKAKTLNEEQLKSAYKEARRHWADYRKNKVKSDKSENAKDSKEKNTK